jgi:NADH dehydrogenase
MKLSGYVAWLAWFFIHVFFLIGFRNRLLVMFEWAWSYVTFERGARLITGETPAPLPPSKRATPEEPHPDGPEARAG